MNKEHWEAITISRRVKRCSRWATLFAAFGVLGICTAIAGGYVFHSIQESQGVLLVVSGAIVAVQSFFISFLIGVFTDIRWLLSRLLVDYAENKTSERKSE